MGYFNIIESLSDTRNNKEVVNEATSILRDYKSVFLQLEKALLSCKDTTLHGDWTFLLYLCVGSMTHVRVLPVFDVSKLHQKEDTKKGRGFIYLDINDVFKADNVVYYYIEDTNNKYSAKDVADFMINGLADTLKREELFIMDDERYTEKFKNDFRDILGVEVETIDDAIKVIKSGSAYKKLSDLIIKGLDIALKEYVSNIKGLKPSSNKSVDMTNDTISICCVDIKEDRVVFPHYGNLEICSIHGNAKKERVVYHTISDVVNKGYTSNSGSDLVLPMVSKDKFRINLSDDKKSWVESRYPR